MNKKWVVQFWVIIALLIVISPLQISAMNDFAFFVTTITKGLQSLLPPPPIMIFEAVKKGDLKKVKKIVTCYKIAVSIENSYGAKAIHIASQTGKLEIVKFFVEQGVDINYQDKYGSTPLHEAAGNGYIELVKYLVDRGANINAQNKGGETPFHVTIKRSIYRDVEDKKANLEIIKYLIEKGADVRIKDLDGYTAPYYAANNGLFKMFKYLCTRWRPLEYAVSRGLVKLVKYLVEDGVPIDEKNYDGKTALDIAVQKGKLEIVTYFVSRLKGSCTPLVWAIRENNLELIAYMIKNGFDVNEQDWLGQTPFQYAAYWGNLEVVKLLIKKGATVDTKDNIGVTALHLSARKHNNFEVVKYLIENGANVNMVPNDERGAIKRADDWGNFEVVKYLIEKGATFDAAVMEKEPQLVRHLITEIMREGESPFHWAIRNDKSDFIKYLVEKCPDIDIDTREKDGKTALYLLSEKGDYDQAKYLVENGAMVRGQANNKLTPCDEANFRSHTKVAEYFELVEKFNKVVVGKLAVDAFAKKNFETSIADFNKQNSEAVRGIVHLGSHAIANSLYDRFLKTGLFVLPLNWPSGAAWLYLYLFTTAKALKQKFFWYNLVNKTVPQDMINNAYRFDFIFKKNLLPCSGMLWENNKLKKFGPKLVPRAVAVKSVSQKFEDIRVFFHAEKWAYDSTRFTRL